MVACKVMWFVCRYRSLLWWRVSGEMVPRFRGKMSAPRLWEGMVACGRVAICEAWEREQRKESQKGAKEKGSVRRADR